MDAEIGSVFLSRGEECGGAGDTWSLDTTFSDILFGSSEKPQQDWLEPSGLHDSESEDVLQAIDPNKVFPRGEPVSESDSGISEEPPAERPIAMPTTEPGRQPPAAIYQVVYDLSGLGTVKAEPAAHSMDIISIELDEWSSRMLFSDSCIVNELPVMSASATPQTTGPAHPTTDDSLLFPDLLLTEEEQKLLNQEGIALPNNLPLTKAEERILKKIRRKIRNKQSAQDSRRRRKEYIDGLENRAAACSAQNKELQRTVDQLEKHNRSLVTQLRRLQSLIKQTASKGAQTSTCILIIVFSLGLIILPSLSPFSRGSSSQDDYKPTGVISRNILTEPASSLPTTDDAESDSPLVQSEPLPSDIIQLGTPDGNTKPEPEIINFELPDSDSVLQEESQSGNKSTVVAGQNDALALRTTAGKGSLEVPKPAHADEM